jgi:hypothetical protein
MIYELKTLSRIFIVMRLIRAQLAVISEPECKEIKTSTSGEENQVWWGPACRTQNWETI